MEPDAPFKEGPYLLVALPDMFDEIVPLNASAFVAEWELALDPVRALVVVGGELLDRLPWTLVEKFVKPGFTTVDWLRRAARDEQIAAVLADATALLRVQGVDAPFVISSLVRDASDAGAGLYEEAPSILLGLAVAATGFFGIGYAGRWLEERLPSDLRSAIEEQRQAEIERRMTERAEELLRRSAEFWTKHEASRAKDQDDS